MPAAWGRRTDDRDALIPIGDHRIFQGTMMFFTAVIVFLLAGVVGSATGSLRGVDNNFLNFFGRLFVIADWFEVTMG